MKKRSGFVSNSSSSSYVILLPDKFNINYVDFEKYQEAIDKYETSRESIVSAFNDFVSAKCLWIEENYAGYEVLREMFDPYVIAEVKMGPNAGQLILADKNVVKKVMDEK